MYMKIGKNLQDTSITWEQLPIFMYIYQITYSYHIDVSTWKLANVLSLRYFPIYSLLVFIVMYMKIGKYFPYTNLL